MKKSIYSILVILLLVLILIFPNASVNGAKYGLTLWFNVIIPSLLPFMIISNIIIHLNIIPYFTVFISSLTKKIFGLSPNGTYALIAGFLFGFPMGAKSAIDLYKSNRITKYEAIYLTTFCNNVSPIFIINFIVNDTLGKPRYTIPTMMIIFMSSFFCGLIFKGLNRKDTKEIIYIPSNTPDKFSFSIIDDSITNAFETITKLGGYLIIFGIIGNLINLIPIPYSLKPLFVGLFEITNGISLLKNSNHDFFTKYMYIIIISSFGGISCLSQTAGFLTNAKLPVTTYFVSKIINTAISILMTLLYINLIYPSYQVLYLP